MLWLLPTYKCINMLIQFVWLLITCSVFVCLDISIVVTVVSIHCSNICTSTGECTSLRSVYTEAYRRCARVARLLLDPRDPLAFHIHAVVDDKTYLWLKTGRILKTKTSSQEPQRVYGKGIALYAAGMYPRSLQKGPEPTTWISTTL